MRFYTHSETPKPESSTFSKTFLIALCVIMILVGVLFAFFLFYYAKSIAGGIIETIVTVCFFELVIVRSFNLEKSYIEINNDEILVVDYSYHRKKEKCFNVKEIAEMQVLFGHSFKVRGDKITSSATQYIVFRNHKKKYLFKVFYTEENYKYFQEYIN